MKRSFIFIALLFGLFSTACAIKKPPMPAIMLDKEAAKQMKKEHGYWIEVQIPQRKLILATGDHIIKTYNVAVGMPDYPSPSGWKHINSIVFNPWWFPPKDSKWVEDHTPAPPRSEKNPLGEIKMPLGGYYLIHGTKAVYSIGQWASHGCIRMLFEDIFGLIELLTSNYSKTSAIEAMERANKEPHTEFAIRLDRDVPVHFTYEPVKISDGYVTISPDVYQKEGDMGEYIARMIEPYLKKKKTPNLKKINNLLKLFQGKTIFIEIDRLAS